MDDLIKRLQYDWTKIYVSREASKWINDYDIVHKILIKIKDISPSNCQLEDVFFEMMNGWWRFGSLSIEHIEIEKITNEVVTYKCDDIVRTWAQLT